MDILLKNKVDNLLQNYETIYSHHKWTSKLIVEFAALIYTLKKKDFNDEDFEELQKYIKDNTGAFSSYRSYHLFIMSTLLLTSFNDPKSAFKDLIALEDKMKQQGFKKNNYSSIAAFSILTSSEIGDCNGRISKSYALYESMKSNHFWLTGYSDYPMAALLSASDKDTRTLTNEMEECYSRLVAEGFSRSDGLQLLSHMLVLSPKSTEEKVATCVKLHRYFKEEGIKIYSNCYEMFGFLCLLEDYAEESAAKVVELYNYLKSVKAFKWSGKEINLMFSISLVSEDYIDKLKNGEIVGTTFSTSIETLIAAQNAAIAGTVAASAAAASSSSS